MGDVVTKLPDGFKRWGRMNDFPGDISPTDMVTVLLRGGKQFTALAAEVQWVDQPNPDGDVVAYKFAGAEEGNAGIKQAQEVQYATKSDVEAIVSKAIDQLFGRLTEAKAIPVPVVEVVELKKDWPQVGDRFLFINSLGDICDDIFSGSEIDEKRIAIGNFYHPEHRASYAKRHIQAMEVQAELRRMPGVCEPIYGSWFIGNIPDKDRAFTAVELSHTSYAHCAIGGVHFDSDSAAFQALHVVTPERIAIFCDDYLQTPMDGDDHA